MINNKAQPFTVKRHAYVGSNLYILKLTIIKLLECSHYIHSEKLMCYTKDLMVYVNVLIFLKNIFFIFGYHLQQKLQREEGHQWFYKRIFIFNTHALPIRPI